MNKKTYWIMGCLTVLSLMGCRKSDYAPRDSSRREALEEIVNRQETENQGKDMLKENAENKLPKKIVIADIKRNPFLTMKEEEYFKVQRGEIVRYLRLSAIFYSPGNSYAVMDGRIIKENDTVGDKKVVAINPDEVVLKDSQGKSYVVKMGKIIDDK